MERWIDMTILVRQHFGSVERKCGFTRWRVTEF
jgi:hypothetical protein